MNCSTIRSLAPFLSHRGELSDGDRAAIEAHLAVCPSCQGWIQREQEFDAAVARVINQVEVPSDLPDAIWRKIATQSRHVHRMRVLRVAAAASAMILVVALGWRLWTSRPVVDPVQWAAWEDQRYVFTYSGSRESAVEFFARSGVKTFVPYDFDYTLLTRLDVVAFEGTPVACLVFQKGANRAKVYVLPKRRFRVSTGELAAATGSHCTVEFAESSRDFVLVIVYFGEPNRQLFMPPGSIG